jgi:peroxiredoxin
MNQWIAAVLVGAGLWGSAAAAEAPKGVAALLAEHDRQLIRDLGSYIKTNPKAADLDQAYLALFERVIENDLFLDNEEPARRYLLERSDGAVRPMAQIVLTMARAQAGKFDEAWTCFRDLLRGLDKDDQEEFAANFADSLANAANASGEYEIARKVYEGLLQKFGTNPALLQKVKDDLARIDRVGKPAPLATVRDIQGKPVRLGDLKGKYVLIDFWATWCNPCVAELPNVQAAYAKFRDKGFEVISVSLDETVEPVVDFVKTRKMTWLQIHNATSGGDLVAAYGVTSIPATFLVGPDGTILRIELRGPALQKALRGMMK